ncbi:MAG: mannose-1-phosphate guanylyltransferase [Planctomycetota bacterium]|nr:mannose-1-phosphate guanylyltransferase [Planctomycetota bacterium]
MRYAMIMAGGAGTRLWPMSRADQPKQLVPFIRRSGRLMSLLQIAAERLEGLVDPRHQYVCTNEAYRAAIRSALPRFTDDLILGEPLGRDTVNAVGFAAAVIQKRDPDAVFAVLTADHLIEPVDLFRDRMELGYELVEKDPSRLVTFSIQPTYPATGFGYVERGMSLPGTEGVGFRAVRFVEKPSVEKAQAYLESGAFGWNSGMFVWKAATILDCLRRYKPESHQGLMKIQAAWGTPDQARVLAEVYPTLPKISVDYAVMEPASREQARSNDGIKVCTVLMDLTWLDVGSWPSFAQTLEPDEAGNRISGTGSLRSCKDTLVVNADPAHHVAVLGCEGMVIVHTKDATLVMPAAQAEDLKALHAQLPEKLR